MAAAESRQQKEVKDLVQCPICLEQLKDPRDLSCTHTFCFKCLQLSQQTEETKMCPFCRSKTLPPASQLTGLPKNRFVSGLIKFLRKDETSNQGAFKKPSESEQFGSFAPARMVREGRLNPVNERPVLPVHELQANRVVLRAQRRQARPARQQPPQRAAVNQNTEIDMAFDKVPDGFEITEDGFVIHPDVLLYNS